MGSTDIRKLINEYEAKNCLKRERRIRPEYVYKVREALEVLSSNLCWYLSQSSRSGGGPKYVKLSLQHGGYKNFGYRELTTALEVMASSQGSSHTLRVCYSENCRQRPQSQKKQESY